jgi:hypothetical protein
VYQHPPGHFSISIDKSAIVCYSIPEVRYSILFLEVPGGNYDPTWCCIDYDPVRLSRFHLVLLLETVSRVRCSKSRTGRKETGRKEKARPVVNWSAVVVCVLIFTVSSSATFLTLLKDGEYFHWVKL